MAKKERPAKKKATLTDRELIKLAQGNDKEAERINKLTAKLTANKAKVIDELEARGTKMLENSGFRITGVWGSNIQYDWEGLRAELKPSQRKQVEIKVISPQLVSQAVQAGVIDQKLVSKYSETKAKKAYYLFTAIDKDTK